MMRPLRDAQVYLCVSPIDFRKSINGLAALVESSLQLDPFASTLFVFSNRKRDRIKILYWERNGFCLWQKRLEEGLFRWPSRMSELVVLDGESLNWLLDGVDIWRNPPHKPLNFRSI